MELSLQKETLAKALSHIGGVVEKRHTMPVLSNVKIDASKDIVFTATDMDIVVSVEVEGTVSKKGGTTVPAHTLYDIVKKLKDGQEVTLSTEDSEDGSLLRVKSGRSNFKLSAIPVSEFPDFDTGEKFDTQFTISPNELIRLIDKTKFAISTEETRYYLNGIYFHAVKDRNVFLAVATDGHRLAKAEMPIPSGAGSIPGVIVPKKTVYEVRKIAESVTDDANVFVSASKIKFSIGKVELTSRLIDGTFPDYERVIPEDNKNLMKVNVKDLSDAIDRVSTICSDRFRSVKLNVENNALTLQTSSPEHGSAEDTLDIEYDASAISIGFNSRYLLEMLSHVGDPNIEILFSDSSSAPALAKDPADEDVLYVIMPMRV